MALYAVVFPVYFAFESNSRAKHMLWATLIYGIVVLLVWLPVVLGTTAFRTYPIPHTFMDKIMAGGYKILFQAYSLPVACLLLVSLATIVRGDRVCSKSTPEYRWLFWSGLVLGVGYVALFFLYPTKPEFLIVTLPFFLLMLVLSNRQTLLTLLVFCTAVSPMYSVDILDGRRLVGLHLTPGDYRTIIAEKPGNRVQYLAGLREMISQPEPILAIGRFDEALVEFLDRKGESNSFVRRFVVWHNKRLLGLSLPTVPRNQLVSSDALMQGGYLLKDGMIDILKEYQTKGYRVAVDQVAFRRWRFLFLASDGVASDHLVLDGVRIDLF
jgi:hypothetical protein